MSTIRFCSLEVLSVESTDSLRAPKTRVNYHIMLMLYPSCLCKPSAVCPWRGLTWPLAWRAGARAEPCRPRSRGGPPSLPQASPSAASGWHLLCLLSFPLLRSSPLEIRTPFSVEASAATSQKKLPSPEGVSSPSEGPWERPVPSPSQKSLPVPLSQLRSFSCERPASGRSIRRSHRF